MSNKDFKWDDELVKEFMLTYNKIDKLITGVDPIIQTMQEWKTSHQPKEELKEDENDFRNEIHRLLKREYNLLGERNDLREKLEAAVALNNLNQKNFTQEQVNKIMEDAFNAARELTPANSSLEKLRREILKEEFTIAAKFETAEDYLKS